MKNPILLNNYTFPAYDESPDRLTTFYKRKDQSDKHLAGKS